MSTPARSTASSSKPIAVSTGPKTSARTASRSPGRRLAALASTSPERRGPRATLAGMNSLNARLLVITPMRIERAAVRHGLPDALVVRCGMGAARARAAAPLAASLPAAAVAVAGFCGAVDEGLRPGDVVVASEVRGPESVTRCASGPLVAALAALGIGRVRVGPVASVDHLVRGAQRGVLAGAGVLAVDMESAWLAPAAAGSPLPCCASCSTRRLVRSTGRCSRSPAASRRGGCCGERRRPSLSGLGGRTGAVSGRNASRP